jgi:multidrug efflux pump subunit AcrA (membrane-fusion protein)
MKQSIKQTGILLTLLTFAGSSVACRQASALAGEVDVPTATVKEANVQLKIVTTGALRAKDSRMIVAPPIAGGTLQIIKLARFGAPVHKGDVVLEFDPSEQEYNLAQNRSDLQQAEQEIVKAKADAAVQGAEDQTALLKARYKVRQAELEVSKNELVSKIDAQKNNLALEEAKRALAQLQQDVGSHSASNKAALAISEEKRNKARLAMNQAEENIKHMTITAPIDGLMVVHPNLDSTGGFFFGQALPDYHVGDQVNPGSSIGEVVDVSHLEVYTQVGETDHSNLKVGQSVDIQVYPLPNDKFTGKVEIVGGATAHAFWDDNAKHKFDVTVLLDKSDPRLRPGFAARLTIRGDELSHAVSIPSEAVFDREGKKVVYCKRNRGFEQQEVKLRALSEGRAVLEGIQPGTVVALVNPEAHGSEKAKEKSSGPPLGPSAK